MSEQPQKPKKQNGGARAGAGRKKGGTNKISGSSIIAALEKSVGKAYEEQLAENYMNAIADGDKSMVAKYDQMFLNKVVADKAEMDITSAGQALQTVFNFGHQELPEWGGLPITSLNK
jgi:hypothetical protein